MYLPIYLISPMIGGIFAGLFQRVINTVALERA